MLGGVWMDNLGWSEQFRNPQVLRQADLTDLPERTRTP